MRPARGFTLPELAAVIVLTGVLAAAAYPRLADRSGFAARGAADFIASSLRHAQKAAIAMRRNVCVTVGATSLAVTAAAAAGGGQACVAPLSHPATGAPFDASPFAGGAVVDTPAAFAFDALGRPVAPGGAALAAPLSLTVHGHAAPVTIEPETGLVH